MLSVVGMQTKAPPFLREDPLASSLTNPRSGPELPTPPPERARQEERAGTTAADEGEEDGRSGAGPGPRRPRAQARGCGRPAGRAARPVGSARWGRGGALRWERPGGRPAGAGGGRGLGPGREPGEGFAEGAGRAAGRTWSAKSSAVPIRSFWPMAAAGDSTRSLARRPARRHPRPLRPPQEVPRGRPRC